MDTVITIPVGKTVALDGNRYKLSESVDVPAEALGEPLKKQETKMRKFFCPHPGCKVTGRAVAGNASAFRNMPCSGTEKNPHTDAPAFLIWADDVTPTEEGEGGEE